MVEHSPEEGRVPSSILGLGTMSKRTSLFISSFALVLVNLIPIFGVLFLGWDVFEIMILYWMESGIIGFYSIVRLGIETRWFAILLIPFFILHFGGFMFGHLMVITAIFKPGQYYFAYSSMSGIIYAMSPILIPFISLFISHGVSFFTNYVTHRKDNVLQGLLISLFEMMRPYKRIMLMQFVLIFGGFATLFFRSQMIVVVLLIIVKTYIDLRAHINEHSPNKSAESKRMQFFISKLRDMRVVNTNYKE